MAGPIESAAVRLYDDFWGVVAGSVPYDAEGRVRIIPVDLLYKPPVSIEGSFGFGTSPSEYLRKPVARVYREGITLTFELEARGEHQLVEAEFALDYPLGEDEFERIAQGTIGTPRGFRWSQPGAYARNERAGVESAGPRELKFVAREGFELTRTDLLSYAGVLDALGSSA